MISNVVGRLLCSKTVVTVWCGWILSLLFQTICLLWTTCSHCCPQRNEFSPSGVSGQQRERGSKRKAMIELIFYIYINLYFSDSGGVTIHFDLSLQGQESIKFKNSFHHLWLLILFGIFFEKKVGQSDNNSLRNISRAQQKTPAFRFSSIGNTACHLTYIQCWGLQTLAVSQFRVCIPWRSIWRPITSLCHAKAVPNWRLLPMQPTNAPSFPSFLRMHGYYPLVASHIPRFSARAKKEDRKRENGDIAWCRSSPSRAWVAEIMT